MKGDLFDTYPELGKRIDALCEGAPWCVTGASALIHDGSAFYFELTKPKHWRRRSSTMVVGIGGIGGSIEPGETILGCLYREVEEELNCRIKVQSATETRLVYEQQVTDAIALGVREHPRPVLFTISQNVYRRHVHPEYSILAIATFLARLQGVPTLDDLFGLLIVPYEALSAIFHPGEIPLGQAHSSPGVRVMTQEPLPDSFVLSPVWTGRSFQLLVQAGCVQDLILEQGCPPP